ncbi:MAG: phosphoglucosamine mutase [Streptosporangiales bacterium]|nr:phosphoglucosamine mutase [Streptosporangiales bacterium]MBO0891689.1 phosphoglucosamine mutase [Acidothermales bacterium]
MARLFGTDGVRGIANRDITAELALDLSVAAAHVLGEAGAFSGHRPTAVVGRDTRASGEFLEAAVVAGLASAGVDVQRVGVLPTPAVAYLADALEADVGVVLSASHNPAADNGIKFFGKGGLKLPDDVEDAVEARLGENWTRPVGPDVGRVSDAGELGKQYVDHLLSTLPYRLDGLRVVVDCAHGAAYEVAVAALSGAGADIVTIGVDPDGLNINDGCGSTQLDTLREAVARHGADAGVAFDGDADRCLAVTADGEDVDGDQIMGVLALAMRDRGDLRADTVVATVMSNLGFRKAMAAAGIEVVETAVGDRYLLEAMRAGGYNLGGEQSGHLLLLDHATTGDGVLTALHLLARVAQTGRPLAELTGVVTRLPQVLVNVSGVDKSRAHDAPELSSAVRDAVARLGQRGRVLLRPSGTEPKVRVMVEAPTEDEARAVAEDLAEVVRRELAL